MTQSPDQAALSLLPVLFIFFVFCYFFIIRPQRKRLISHQQMLDSLKVGDQIMFSGGILATVDRIHEDILSVSVSKDVIIRINRHSVTDIIQSNINQSGEIQS